jgi:hypothetical protein
MEAPPLSSQQHCQDECAYGCEDDCGHYDADGRFIERRPGCYQTCYSDCTQVPNPLPSERYRRAGGGSWHQSWRGGE